MCCFSLSGEPASHRRRDHRTPRPELDATDSSERHHGALGLSASLPLRFARSRSEVCARNADSATNRPAMLILALRRPTDHQDERYWSSYAGSLQTVSSQCSSRACRESMPTTAVLVCADSGDVAVLARTAWSVLFCRKHTRPRTLDWSTCCRWWCIEVVARPPGHAGRKREPAVRVLETKAAFAVPSRVRRTC